MSNPFEKVCYTCKVSLPLVNFSKDKNKNDGFATKCKSCMKIYHKKHYESHKEKLVLYQVEYRKNNKGNIALWKSEYYKNNRESIALKHAEYHQSNKEWLSVKASEYQKKHPEISSATRHKRRALKRKSGGSFTPEQIKLQDQRQKNKCYYCHKKMGSKKTIEHVIPLSRGGSNDMSNVVLACSHCNISKNAKLPHEWPQGGRLL